MNKEVKAQRPEHLNLFCLGEDVTNSLQLLYFDDTLSIVDPNDQNSKKTQNDSHNITRDGCLECGCKFNLSREDKVKHYKSDWHAFNLRRSIRSMPRVSEYEFNEKINRKSDGQMEDQETSEEEEEEEEEEELSDENQHKTFLKLDPLYEKLHSLDINYDDDSAVSFLNTRSPFIYLRSNLLSSDKVFAVYKAMFTAEEMQLPLSALKSWSKEPIKGGKSAVLMIGSGHFAGAIISHTPKSIKTISPNLKEPIEEELVNVIASKTFHRYTTRRKQGGSQSANDNSKGKANSAGSTIRRYNEQALLQEVRQLLSSWKEDLDACHTIFIRANGSSRKILLGYENSVILNNDRRISNLPFTTKRPTTSEIRKAWARLSYLNITEVPRSIKDEKMKLEKQKESLENSKVQKESKVEKADDDIHSEALAGFIRRSKAPLLVAYLRKHDISPNFRLSPSKNFPGSPTLLHYASSQNSPHIIEVLLVNLKADPTLMNSSNKTPAEIAGGKQSRNAFRNLRLILGEDFCDWEVAKVGTAKSKEEFHREEKEEQDRIELDKKKLISAELSKKLEMPDKVKRPLARQLKPEANATRILERSGLSEEQKKRLMREERARAAEARMKKMQG